MNIKLKNAVNWLLPVFLILFILEVIAFPFAVGLTYAGRSEDPDHTLTYRTAKLTWSDVAGIDENGVAELSLFDAAYDNVSSQDGSAVVAPGTEGYHIIRLTNAAESTVSFTAVLYAVKSSGALPVQVRLENGEYTDTATTILPQGISNGQIIRSVTGSVRSGGYTDFDICWLWDYEISADQDLIDVDFGNKSANGIADDITVGFYLVVEDDGEIIPPKTGDSMDMALYLTLMGISGGATLLLLVTRKREKEQA